MPTVNRIQPMDKAFVSSLIRFVHGNTTSTESSSPSPSPSLSNCEELVGQCSGKSVRGD
eukprot:Awhi_evm1s15079